MLGWDNFIAKLGSGKNFSLFYPKHISPRSSEVILFLLFHITGTDCAQTNSS